VGNIGIGGALAAHVDVPANRVLAIPDDMDLAEAALVEPVAVAVHALTRISRPNHGIIVMGAGPIGLLTALVAKSQGIKPITIMDIQESRLTAARELAIDFAFNSDDRDLSVSVGRIYPDGPGAIFDCAAAADTLNQALHLARKGTSVVLEGVPEGPITLDAILIQDRELSIVGTLMYRITDFKKAIDLIYQKQIPVGRLITRKVKFEDVPSVFQQLVHNPGLAIKVLVKI
jgi:L-iditol 2-dehydrogenase